MNLKSFALKAAIAATVLTGSTLAVSPAEALEFGSELDFVWNVNATSDSLDFNMLNGYPGSQDGPGGADTGEFFVTNATKSFLDLPEFIGTIKDIPSLAKFEAINNFLFFEEGSPFNFKLTAFNYSGQVEGFALYDFEGIFADGTLGEGSLSTQYPGSGPRSYSVTIVAGNEIPTPALLPGLIGMGVAVLRKRNGEENEQAEAEA